MSSSEPPVDTSTLNGTSSVDRGPVVLEDDELAVRRGAPVAERLSAVVPTRDSAATLEACLRSVRAQRVPVEVIVVDNGSTDATLEIAGRFADRVIHAGPERSAQRNVGAYAARGGIVLFVDSDMVLPEDLAPAILDAFERDPELRAVVVPEVATGEGFWAACKVLEKQLYLGDASVEAARAFPRDVFVDAGGYDEELFAGEDWDLADRVDATKARTGRVEPVIVHDEGRLTLRQDLRKKLYYGRSLRTYFRKDRSRAASRIARPTAIARGVPMLVRHPLTATGLVVMKVLELAAAAAGLLSEVAPLRRTRGVGATRWRAVLTYAAPALIAALVVQVWFHAGSFIASGDVAPFIRDDLSAEGLSLWSHSLTGGGSASFQSAARLPEIILLDASHAIGLSDAAAQQLLFTMLAAAAVAAATYFARTFVPPGSAASLGGLVALFNPFMLQHLPNPLQLWAVAIVAAIGGLMLRAARGDGISPFALVVVSLGSCYLALNPPLLVVVVLWGVTCSVLGGVMFGGAGLRRAVHFVVRATPWMLLLNVWWILPFVVTLSSAGSGYGIAAQTDVQAWGWTHARLSIPNVLTLSGHWGWNQPEYFPYAEGLDGGAWAALKFGLPALAVLSIPFAARGQRRAPLVLVCTIAALMFVGKGLHPPFTGASAFLYAHVPGMWLLREPLSKVGPMLIICYTATIAISIHGIGLLAREAVGSATRTARRITVGIAVGVLIYPMPLWTGAVIADDRPLLPSAHVIVPAAWQQLADTVNESSLPGKVLVLPLDDYYQMPTKWGYYGADSIPRSLLTRPTIQPLPGGYYRNLDGYASLVGAVQTALDQRDLTALPRLLGSLEVSYVVVRHDLDRTYVARHLPDPAPIDASLSAAAGIELVDDFGVARLYRVESPMPPVSTVRKIVRALDLPADAVPLVIGSAGDVVVADQVVGATGIGRAEVVTPMDPSVRIGVSSRDAVLSTRTLSTPLFEVEATTDGDRSSLGLRPIPTVALSGQALGTDGSVTIPTDTDARIAAVSVDGQVVPLGRASRVLAIQPDAKVTAFASTPARLGLDALDEVQDCDAFDDRSADQAGLSAELLGGSEAPGVRLQARIHSACVYVPIRHATPGRIYLLRFSYRTMGGASARFCVLQTGTNACALERTLKPASSWIGYRGTVTVPADARGLKFVAYADGGRDAAVTTVDYRSLSVSLLTSAGSHVLRAKPTPSVTVPVTSSDTLSLRVPAGTSLETQLSPLGDCNAVDERLPSRLGLSASPLPGGSLGVRLQAREHTACVSTEVEGFVPGASLILHLQSRSLSGMSPRVCLWQVGPDRCATLPPLPDGSTWATSRSTFTPQQGTTGIRLYLYADADAGLETVTEYRDLDIETAPPVAATLIVPPSGGVESPDTVVDQRSLASYRVNVAASATSFLLVLRESYADGWQLRGVPSDRVVRHVTVDGYANGWWISPGRAMTIEITYAPEAWARRARVASLVSLIVLLGVVLARRQRHGSEPDSIRAAETG